MSNNIEELLERLCGNVEKLTGHVKAALDHIGERSGVYPPGTSALAICRCGATDEYATAIAEMMERNGVSMAHKFTGGATFLFYADYPREHPMTEAECEWVYRGQQPHVNSEEIEGGPSAFVAAVLKQLGKA